MLSKKILSTCAGLATVATLSLLVPAPGLAAEDEGLKVGARVRVTAPEVSRHFFEGDADRRLVGEVLSLDDECLTVKVGRHEDPAVVPRSSVQRLEIRRSSSKKGRGLLIGLLVGTGIGVGLAHGGSSLCDSTSVSGCDVAVAAVLLGLPASLAGAIVAPGERWEDTRVDPPPVRVGLAPAPGGGVGISVQWVFGASQAAPRRVPGRRTASSSAGPPAPFSVVAARD